MNMGPVYIHTWDHCSASADCCGIYFKGYLNRLWTNQMWKILSSTVIDEHEYGESLKLEMRWWNVFGLEKMLRADCQFWGPGGPPPSHYEKTDKLLSRFFHFPFFPALISIKIVDLVGSKGLVVLSKPGGLESETSQQAGTEVGKQAGSNT